MNSDIPSHEEFFNFSETANELKLKRLGLGLLSLGISYEYDHNKAEHLKRHKIFLWANKNGSMLKALNAFKRKSFYKNQLAATLGDYCLIEFLKITSMCLGMYCLEIRGSVRVVPKSTKKEALKPISKLNKLLDKGVLLFDSGETSQLKSLLSKLEHEINTDAPSYYPEKKTGYLPQHMLVKRLGMYFKAVYGKCNPAIIGEILKAIGQGTSDRQLARWLKDVEDYTNYKNRMARMAMVDAILKHDTKAVKN